MAVRNESVTTQSEIYDMLKIRPCCSGQWTARLDRHSGQNAYFAVTGEIWETLRGRKRGEIGGGCLHDDLQALADTGKLRGRDTILPELLRWHLFDVRRGPMHYIANGVYWLQRHLRSTGTLPGPRSTQRYLASTTESDKAEDKRALECFKSTIVFGALADDEIPAIPDFGPNKFAGAEGSEADKRDAWIIYCESEIDRVIRPWLEARLPRLMEAFEADMVRWFGPGIVEPATA